MNGREKTDVTPRGKNRGNHVFHVDRYVCGSRGKTRLRGDEKRGNIGIAELAQFPVEFPSLCVIPAGHPRKATHNRALDSDAFPRIVGGERNDRVRRRETQADWLRRPVAGAVSLRTSTRSKSHSSGRDPAAAAARRRAVSRGSRGSGPGCEAEMAGTSRMAATKLSVSFKHSRRKAVSSALIDDWRKAISFSTSSCIPYEWRNGESETVVHWRGSSGRKRKPRRMSASAVSTPRMSQICLLLRGRERAKLHRAETTGGLGGRED